MSLVRIACADTDAAQRLEAVLRSAGYAVAFVPTDQESPAVACISGSELISRQRIVENLIADCAATLLDASEASLDQAIEHVLQRCGEFVAADRAYLFLLSSDGVRMSNTHEWHADGVSSERDAVQEIPVSAAPWWWSRISTDDLVNIDSVADLPLEAASERAMFEAKGIVALFAFALRKSGKTFGFLRCDAVNRVAPWAESEIGFIGTVANLVSSALHRAEAEALAHRHQERLRLGQIAANIGTWEWNVRTGELFWSERMAPLLGRDPTDTPTLDEFVKTIPEDERDLVLAAIKSSVQDNRPFEVEHRTVWPDGTVRWLLERGAVIRDGEGKALKMFGIVQDINDRKQLELALAKREHLLSTILNTTQQGFWFIDLDGITTDLNPAMCRILGRARDEVIGHSVYDFVDAENREFMQAELARRRNGFTTPYELALRKADGSTVHCINTPSLLQDEDGHIVASVGIWTDVSELRRIQDDLSAINERLSAAYEEAERANRAKSEFLSSMSHELRTPMNSILGFGQLLECDDSLPEEQQDNVHEILRAGRHLLELINEVLDLAKVESGRIDLSIEPVRLAPLVTECIGLVQVIADKREITLHAEGYRDLAIRADRTRLKQALLNLLSNAIKYNRPSGEVRLQVQVGAPSMLRIEIVDTGPGIPLEKQGQLFQPFNRLDAEHTDIEGTGIGLTLTRRIVEMMGGSVGFESTAGMGSRFWIELPQATLDTDDPTPPDAAPGPTHMSETPQRARHLILYIEDNPANLRLVTNILGRRPDIDLVTAHSPELGLELARARLPALILLDINMPELNGYQVMGVLQADARTKHIPVVAITANAMRRDIQRGLRAGFSDYLTKPIDITRFNEVLDTHLPDDERLDHADQA